MKYFMHDVMRAVKPYFCVCLTFKFNEKASFARFNTID